MLWSEKCFAFPCGSPLFYLLFLWPTAHSEITGWSFFLIFSLPSLLTSSLFQLPFQNCLNTPLLCILPRHPGTLYKKQPSFIASGLLQARTESPGISFLLKIDGVQFSQKKENDTFPLVYGAWPFGHIAFHSSHVNCITGGQWLSEGETKYHVCFCLHSLQKKRAVFVFFCSVQDSRPSALLIPSPLVDSKGCHLET